MTKYFIKRFFLLLLTCLGVILLLYIIFAFANYKIWTRGLSNFELIKMSLLDFKYFITGVITEWDFGMYSVSTDIWDRFTEELPITFMINSIAILVFIPVGVLLGIFTAYFHKTIWDKLVSYIFVVLASVPSFLLMFFLMLFFGYYLKWFPGRYDYYADGVITGFKANFLPVLALSIVPATRVMRLLRSELIEAQTDEYVQLARIKGFSRFRTMIRHSLRNSILPVLSELPRSFTMIVSMSFIIEILYNIRGAGLLLYQSVITPSIDGNYFSINVPVATLICSSYIIFVLVLSFLVDIAQGLIDPRIKLGTKKSSYLGAK